MTPTTAVLSSSAPAQSSPLVTAPVLTQQTGDNDDNDNSADEGDTSIDRTDSPAAPTAAESPAVLSSLPPVSSTDSAASGSRDLDEIDELDDSPTDAALPDASNRPGTSTSSQTSAPALAANRKTRANQPKKVTGKYATLFCCIYSILIWYRDVSYDDWKKQNPKGSKRSHENNHWKNLTKEQKQVGYFLFSWYPIRC